jgi:hypothetical protein
MDRYRDFVAQFIGQKGKLSSGMGFPNVEFYLDSSARSWDGWKSDVSILEVGEDYVVFGYDDGRKGAYPLSLVSINFK